MVGKRLIIFHLFPMLGLSEKEIRRAAYRQALANKYKNQIIDSIGINEDAIKAGVSKKDYRQYTLQYYTVAKTKTEDKLLLS